MTEINGDFDRFQNSLVSAFWENGSAGSGSAGRAGSIAFRLLIERVNSVQWLLPLGVVILSEAKNLRLFGFAVSQQ